MKKIKISIDAEGSSFLCFILSKNINFLGTGSLFPDSVVMRVLEDTLKRPAQSAGRATRALYVRVIALGLLGMLGRSTGWQAGHQQGSNGGF